MKLAEINPGTKLELELYDSLGEKQNINLVSEFEWMKDEKTAIIATPIKEGVLFPIYIGTIMEVYFIQKANLYNLKAKVLERKNEDNISLLKVEILSDIRRLQRRQFFRLECILDIKYRNANSVVPGTEGELPYIKAITRDLSGSGLCMLTEQSIDEGRLLECQLLLDECTCIKLYGKVVRVGKCDVEGKYKYEIGVLFKKITDRDRELVIGYIFQEQRKLRKKGLI